MEVGDRVFIAGLAHMEGQVGTVTRVSSDRTYIYANFDGEHLSFNRRLLLPYDDDPEVRAARVREHTLAALERGLRLVSNSWWRGSAQHHPSLSVDEDGRAWPLNVRSGSDVVQAVDGNDNALDAIRRALHMPVPGGEVRDNEDLYLANDGQPASMVGRLWVIGAIERAVSLVALI